MNWLEKRIDRHQLYAALPGSISIISAERGDCHWQCNGAGGVIPEGETKVFENRGGYFDFGTSGASWQMCTGVDAIHWRQIHGR